MKRVENNIKISNQLLQFLKGDLLPEEEQQVKQLLHDDKDLADWWSKFKTNDHIEERLNEYAQLDLNEKWRIHISKRKSILQKKQLIQWTSIAASILVIVAVSWWGYNSKQQVEIKNIALNSIQPGGSKAELIVENGNRYILPELKPGVIKEQGTAIAHDGRALTYDIGVTSDVKATLKAPMHTIVVPRGGEHQLTLGDGTKVWLNAESKLRYPAWFDGTNREVELSGEGFFKVAHNASKPFFVNTNGVRIKVLGTEFNVKAYGDENEIATTLVNGKVNVQLIKSDENIFLEPEQQASVKNNSLQVKEVDAYYYTAWKDGLFVFKGERIQDIFQRLSRWYDFDVFFYNESVKDYSFTGTIERTDEISQVLMLLERTNRIKFKIEGKTILVSEL